MNWEAELPGLTPLFVGQDTPEERLTCVAVAYVSRNHLGLVSYLTDLYPGLEQDVFLHLKFPLVAGWCFMTPMRKSLP